MVIYLEHPKHGFMPVYTNAEAYYNEQFGWKRVNPPEVKVEEPVDRELTVAERYEKKFGHPPHHRMKLETIENALKE